MSTHNQNVLMLHFHYYTFARINISCLFYGSINNKPKYEPCVSSPRCFLPVTHDRIDHFSTREYRVTSTNQKSVFNLRQDLVVIVIPVSSSLQNSKFCNCEIRKLYVMFVAGCESEYEQELKIQKNEVEDISFQEL